MANLDRGKLESELQNEIVALLGDFISNKVYIEIISNHICKVVAGEPISEIDRESVRTACGNIAVGMDYKFLQDVLRKSYDDLRYSISSQREYARFNNPVGEETKYNTEIRNDECEDADVDFVKLSMGYKHKIERDDSNDRNSGFMKSVEPVEEELEPGVFVQAVGSIDLSGEDISDIPDISFGLDY